MFTVLTVDGSATTPVGVCPGVYATTVISPESYRMCPVLSTLYEDVLETSNFVSFSHPANTVFPSLSVAEPMLTDVSSLQFWNA